MIFLVGIVVCSIMAIISAIGVCEVNKYEVAALWMLIALQSCMLSGLAESYKAAVVMLGK